MSRPIHHPSAGVCDRDHFVEHRTASLGEITTWPVCLKLPSHYSKYQEVVGAWAQRFMTQPPTPLQSYLPGSHDIMYLLTCELAVSRFATARVGSPNRPDFAGHKNRGGARRSHFCGSAQALRSDIDRSFQPRANLRRWPTPGAAWPMKKRVSPGARRAIILIHARSISRLETAFGRCDLCRLASSVRDLGRQHLRELEGRIRRRGLSNFSEFGLDVTCSGGATAAVSAPNTWRKGYLTLWGFERQRTAAFQRRAM